MAIRSASSLIRLPSSGPGRSRSSGKAARQQTTTSRTSHGCRSSQPTVASTKHNAGRTTASPSRLEQLCCTVSTCHPMCSTNLVSSRPPTMSRSSRAKSPPLLRSSRRLPGRTFASITQTPAGVTAMWSMLLRLPGLCRSWRATIPTMASNAAPTLRSPGAPVTQARTCWGAGSARTFGVTAAASRPAIGCSALTCDRQARSAVTRAACCRSCRADLRSASRVTDRPAVPRSNASADGSGRAWLDGSVAVDAVPRHDRQVTVFAPLSHPARSPACTVRPQDTQLSCLRRTSIFTQGVSAHRSIPEGHPPTSSGMLARPHHLVAPENRPAADRTCPGQARSVLNRASNARGGVAMTPATTHLVRGLRHELRDSSIRRGPPDHFDTPVTAATSTTRHLHSSRIIHRTFGPTETAPTRGAPPSSGSRRQPSDT